MKVLVTGARGYLGALLSVALSGSHDVVRTSRGDISNSLFQYLDVTDADCVKRVVAATVPDVIIHAAAMANLSVCEANPEAAFLVNAEGTLNVVQAANEVGARVLFISTLAASNPSIVYGRSKSAAEEHVKHVRMGHEIVQLSMTFGLSPNRASRRPFNKMLESFQTGKPRIYDNAWLFQPTCTEHVIAIVRQLLCRPFEGRRLAVTVDKRCTMYDIANDLLGPALVKGAALYRDREVVCIEADHLSRLGLPTMTYATMLQRMRIQLLTCAPDGMPNAMPA
ncbi:SDR family oxidoreductase [Ralstonia pseudosolanacearum]|uniref:dTDP-4-dehydrorhamnose reductase n=1 Tax=Ralstonia solanacearum TaxID=305 RepID=A0A0S4WXI3_RALSL|nr:MULTISPECIES: NAD(P)-dependent oxidoreductase [Ralstonia]MCF1442167.1 NAD(P)-dependent oxidoreductase [Ralstonia solanacearum]QWQ12256.1 NAD(P)-dependent oxidoreductase [Ralstonia solanacearum]UZF15284.1 NAD(P)-dependent oxidoreductase [Ralstonia solanacearum]UZF25335.1 NAD(P)-dependent oxidoreductase [Ralstonia sp. RS642]UZF30363.1 NAD(P)-dependent oxidoreductase [Ralstonia sp. RS650]